MFSGTADPRWRSARHWPPNAWPPALDSWLLGEDSLTRRLRARCAGDGFRVSIRQQGWGRPLASERDVLGMAPRTRAWMREVYLWCGTERWVYARTVIPYTTLTGKLRRLRHLGTRPLGEVIFADTTMRRSAVEVARIEVPMAEQDRASRAMNTSIWGRRSVFWLQQKPLLVCEFFLPHMAGTRA